MTISSSPRAARTRFALRFVSLLAVATSAAACLPESTVTVEPTAATPSAPASAPVPSEPVDASNDGLTDEASSHDSRTESTDEPGVLVAEDDDVPVPDLAADAASAGTLTVLASPDGIARANRATR